MLHKSKSDNNKSFLSTASSRQKFLLNWINTLTSAKPLTTSELPEKFRTGTYPLSLLSSLNIPYNPSTCKIPPKSKEDWFYNIKTFLSSLQSKGLSNPSSFETFLYQGKSQQCWEIVEFLFSSVYLPEIFESSEDLFAWFSNTSQCEISYSEILLLFKDGSLILKALNEQDPNIEFIDFPEDREEILQNLETIEKTLKQKNIPFLFSPLEFYLNEHGDCLFAQLWLIFTHLEEGVSKNATKSSTETSSKNSFVRFEVGLSESKSNLDLVEKKIVNEERKLMYLSDLRMKKEGKEKTIVSVPSVKEIPHCSSQPILSNAEILICYLLTPRIIQVYIQGKIVRVLINFIPDAEKFSLKNERYLLELKELSRMDTIFVCEVEEIENFDCQGMEMYIWVRKQPVKMIFKSEEECLKYLNGFEYLLEKYGLSY